MLPLIKQSANLYAVHDRNSDDLNSDENTTTNPLGRGMARACIETCCTMPGTVLSYLCRIPKFLLSAIPRWIGQKIQGGYDRRAHGWEFARYGVGSLFVGLGNICGGLIGLAEGLLQMTVVNIVERVLRALIALAVVVGGAAHSAWEGSYESLRAAARKAITIWSPNLTDLSYETNGVVNRGLLAEHQMFSAMASSIRPLQSGGFQHQQYLSLKGCRQLHQVEIPESVLARDQEDEVGYGSKLKLRADYSDPAITAYRSDAWSGLRVTFFEIRPPDNPPTYVINFNHADGIGSGKTILAASLGITDSGFQAADQLVKAFVEEFGCDNVVVVGASKGGALAQFAGMNNGTAVYAFNPMGLHSSHLRQLGSNLDNRKNVSLICTEGDCLQDLLPITPLRLVGRRYQVPGMPAPGHLAFTRALFEYENNLPPE